jgi:hypothetical protein
MFYTETVDSFFHLCGCGNPHNRTNIDALVAGSVDIDNTTKKKFIYGIFNAGVYYKRQFCKRLAVIFRIRQ